METVKEISLIKIWVFGIVAFGLVFLLDKYMGPGISKAISIYTSIEQYEYYMNSSDGSIDSDNSPLISDNDQKPDSKKENSLFSAIIVEDNIGGRILLVGDSLMLTGFGPVLEGDLVKFQNTQVVRQGKYSSGLNKTNFYDWNKRTAELIDINDSDYLIVMFGANDGQEITNQNGKGIRLYANGWTDAYTQRVKTYLALVAPKVKTMFWVGHPVPGNNDFYRKFAMMNPIYKSECEALTNCVYINLWDRFLVNGQFSQIVADDNGKKGAVKSADGVHVTIHGGKIMSTETIKQLKEYINLIPK